MHLNTASNATQLMGAVNGVYIAGALIGSIVSSVISDSLGRKMSVFVAAAFEIVGGALQAGSVNIGMFIAARLISGLGIGIPRRRHFVDQSKLRPSRIYFHGCTSVSK